MNITGGDWFGKRSVFRFCVIRLVTLTTGDEWRTTRTDGHSSASWTITTAPWSSATNTCTQSPASTGNSSQIMITRYAAYDKITDRIRSMAEGYVFTGVCHSVHNWGGLPPGGSALCGGSPSERVYLLKEVCLLGVSPPPPPPAR